MNRKTIAWSAKLIFSFTIIFILYENIPISRLTSLIAQTSQNYLLAACSTFLAGQALLSWRLMLLTDINGLNISYIKLLQVNLTSLFYKMFIPGGTITSILLRSYKLKQVGNRIDSTISIILFDRLLSTIGLFIGGVIFWGFYKGILPQKAWGVVFGIFLAMGGLFCCMIIITFAFQFFSSRVSSSTILDRFQGRASAMIMFKRLDFREYLAIFVLTTFCHLFGVATFIFLALSLNISLCMICIGWIRAAIILLTMLPISFAGLGIRDGVMVYFFHLFDLSTHEALALSFLIFIVTVILGAVIGGVWELFALIGKSYKKSG